MRHIESVGAVDDGVRVFSCRPLRECAVSLCADGPLPQAKPDGCRPGRMKHHPPATPNICAQHGRVGQHRSALLLAVFACLPLLAGQPTQPIPPLPQIPAGLSPELQASITELAEGRDRAWEQGHGDIYLPKRHGAIVALAKLGAAAAPAVPFLVYYIDQDSVTRVDRVENRQGAALYDYITKRDQRFDVSIVHRETQDHYVMIQDALVKIGKAATPELVKTLRDPQASDKRLLRCLPVLEELQDHEALPDLLTLSRQTKNPQVKAAALYAAGTWAEERPVNALLKEALVSSNIEVQRAAAAGLASVKAWDPTLADFWRQAWCGADLELACHGVEAVAHCQTVPDNLLEPLIQSLAVISADNPNVKDIQETVRQLVKRSQVAALPFLIKAAVADSDRLRLQAVKLLGESGDGRAADMLRRRACLDPERNIALLATLALIERGTPPFSQALMLPSLVVPVEALCEGQGSGRPYTLDDIRALCTEADVLVLVRTIGNSLLNQEQQASQGRPMLTAPGAMVSVREALGSNAPPVGSVAVATGRRSPLICLDPPMAVLAALGEKIDPWLVAAFGSADPLTRAGALRLLGDASPFKRVPPTALAALLAAARTDPSPANRILAARGLWLLKATEYSAVMAELLSDKTPEVANRALLLVSNMPTPAAIHPLLERYAGLTEADGANMGNILRRVGCSYEVEFQTELLLALEKHADPAVRRGAAACLPALPGSPEIEQALLRTVAQDKDAAVRQKAMLSLLELSGHLDLAAPVVVLDAAASQLARESDAVKRSCMWNAIAGSDRLKPNAVEACRARLAEALEKHADSAVRRGAARCLMEGGQPPWAELAKPLLHAAGADQDADVRREALEALLAILGYGADDTAILTAAAAQLAAETDQNNRIRMWQRVNNSNYLNQPAVRACRAFTDLAEQKLANQELAPEERAVLWQLQSRYFPPAPRALPPGK